MGVKKPMSSISASVPAAIARTVSPFLNVPSTIRMYAITPRYWSYSESKISARGGASGSPEGGGTRCTIYSSSSVTPSPVLAEIRRTHVRVLADQLRDLLPHPLGLGAGQVDLVHGRDQLEPGVDRQVGVGDGLGLDALGGVDDQHARPRTRRGERDTSYVKSTWPGVSIRCSW